MSNPEPFAQIAWLRLVVAGAATWLFAGFVSYELGPPIWETVLVVGVLCAGLGLWLLSRAKQPDNRVRMLLLMAALMAAIAVVNALQGLG
jgi:hypothetical protein